MGNLETFLMRYIHTCSDENELNKDFPSFLENSHYLYNILFSPFGLQAGRVVICQDNNLVPFESLTHMPQEGIFSFMIMPSAMFTRHSS